MLAKGEHDKQLEKRKSSRQRRDGNETQTSGNSTIMAFNFDSRAVWILSNASVVKSAPKLKDCLQCGGNWWLHEKIRLTAMAWRWRNCSWCTTWTKQWWVRERSEGFFLKFWMLIDFYYKFHFSCVSNLSSPCKFKKKLTFLKITFYFVFFYFKS